MTSIGRRHRDDPSLNQLLGIARVRPLAELLGGHQGLGGCHGTRSSVQRSDADGQIRRVRRRLLLRPSGLGRALSPILPPCRGIREQDHASVGRGAIGSDNCEGSRSNWYRPARPARRRDRILQRCDPELRVRHRRDARQSDGHIRRRRDIIEQDQSTGHPPRQRIRKVRTTGRPVPHGRGPRNTARGDPERARSRPCDSPSP